MPQILGSSCELLEGLARARPVNRLCPHLCTCAICQECLKHSYSCLKTLAPMSPPLGLLQDSFLLPSPEESPPSPAQLLLHGARGVCVQPVSPGWKLLEGQAKTEDFGGPGQDQGREQEAAWAIQHPLFPSRGLINLPLASC